MNWRSAGLPPGEATPQGHDSFPAYAPTLSDEFDRLKGLPAEEKVPAGTILQKQGANATSVVLICHGLAKLTMLCPEGRESILGLRSSGWYAGALSALVPCQNIYSVETVSECLVSCIPASEFHLWLTRSARMSRHFTQTLCNEVLSQSSGARMRCGSAESRLSHFMTECHTSDPSLKTLDPLPMLKQMELAQLLAITPEHLNRLLRRSVLPDEAIAQLDPANKEQGKTALHGSQIQAARKETSEQEGRKYPNL